MVLKCSCWLGSGVFNWKQLHGDKTCWEICREVEEEQGSKEEKRLQVSQELKFPEHNNGRLTAGTFGLFCSKLMAFEAGVFGMQPFFCITRPISIWLTTEALQKQL